ncbi:MAG: PQQ-binding-like beta-propeller repeat protein [Planctomycetaceae bacterium]
MNRFLFCSLTLTSLMTLNTLSHAQDTPQWNQWRGPNRDGIVSGNDWPSTLSGETLKQRWRVELPPSYSGPVVSQDKVFVTGTEKEDVEVVFALSRSTGEQIWRVEWPGAMKVPFFAAANGSWIRATPAFDGETLYVAGMRDVLVALDAESGKEKWRVDFVESLKTPLPAFGFASSPLVDENFVYVQAGGAFIKLDKRTGKIIWRVLDDGGGMFGSAFSSPTTATICGKQQLLVQTREKLAGVDPATGAVLWEQVVPSYRGMNILTPVAYGDAIFTSSYQNNAWLYNVSQSTDGFQVTQGWENNAKGYMSTPVLIEGHVYLHLQNQRFTCINLETGERTWTSTPFGKYSSLVAQGDKILALDQEGELLLIKATPKEFELIDRRKVSEDETWAHVAISGQDIFVRELKALTAFEWSLIED